MISRRPSVSASSSENCALQASRDPPQINKSYFHDSGFGPIKMVFSFSFNFSNKQDQSRGASRQPRKSCENRCLSPLLDEGATKEGRYYRSAQFQQALIEQEDERGSLMAHRTSREDIGRRSRYHRQNSNPDAEEPDPNFASNPEESNQVPRFLPDTNAQAEVPWTACDANEISASSPTYSTSNSNSAAPKPEPDEQQLEPNRPRILIDGVGPLVSFARNRKLE